MLFRSPANHDVNGYTAGHDLASGSNTFPSNQMDPMLGPNSLQLYTPSQPAENYGAQQRDNSAVDALFEAILRGQDQAANDSASFMGTGMSMQQQAAQAQPTPAVPDMAFFYEFGLGFGGSTYPDNGGFPLPASGSGGAAVGGQVWGGDAGMPSGFGYPTFNFEVTYYDDQESDGHDDDSSDRQ